MPNDFWLIQRLLADRAIRPEAGFDGFFSLDYMGAAEFEFGAVGAALRSMRSAPLDSVSKPVRVDGKVHTVHFVGHDVDRRVTEFQEWIDGGERTKEPPYMGRRIKGDDSWSPKADAWWAIDVDVAWALDESMALRLLDAFNTTKAVSA